ncbi:MAG: hypothetical protein LBH02_03500 [Methanocalculaceae archaeon]|jgi:hypothetical protein|nr:hypothetical protein [Methanocalculaceae archaeon]
MDTRMKFLEHELAEQEREMIVKHEIGANAISIPIKSETTHVLERKIRELEAMVKGLTEEMLDLKSVTRKLAMQLEDLCGCQSKIHEESKFFQKKSEFTPETNSQIQESIQRSMPVHAVPSRHHMANESILTRRSHTTSTDHMRAETSNHTISSSASESVPASKSEIQVEHLKAGEYQYVMQPDGTIQKRKKTTDHSVIIAETGYNQGHTSRSMTISSNSNAVIEAAEDDIVMDDSKEHR